MPAKKIVLEKMPSGAQQFVRGNDRYAKSNTLGDYEQNELDEMKDNKLNTDDFLSHSKKFGKFSEARSDNSDAWDKESAEKKYARDFGEEGQIGKKRGGSVMKHDHGHKPMVKMSTDGHYCWGGKAMKKAEGGPIKKDISPEELRKMYEKNRDKPTPKRNTSTIDDLTTRMGEKHGGAIHKAKGGNWIKSAIKHPGALRKSLGVPAGKTIPAGKLEKASHAPGKMGQRARLAMTLKGMK
jgi:hypothetical protein